MFFFLEAFRKIAELDKSKDLQPPKTIQKPVLNEQEEIVLHAAKLANEKMSSFSEQDLKNYAFDKLVDDYIKQLRRR